MEKYKSIFFKETEDIEQSKDSKRILKELASADIINDEFNIDVPSYYLIPSEVKDIFDRVFGV